MLGKLLGLCSAFMLSLAMSCPSNCILMSQQHTTSDRVVKRIINNYDIQNDTYAPYISVSIPQDANNYRMSYNDNALQNIGEYAYYRVQNYSRNGISTFDYLEDQEAFILMLPQQYEYSFNGNTATVRTFVPYYFTYSSWEQIDDVIYYYYDNDVFDTVALYLSSGFIYIKLCPTMDYPGDGFPTWKFGYSSFRTYYYSMSTDDYSRIIGAMENYSPLGFTPPPPTVETDAIINALKSETGDIFNAFKNYTYNEIYAVDGNLERFYQNVMASDWVKDSEWAQTYILSIRQSGLVRGESAGYSDGYQAGYEDAIENEELAEPVGNFFSRVFTSLSSILNTHILGPLTLGSFLAIPLVIGVIVFIIKLAG